MSPRVEEFVSEPLVPHAGTFDVRDMAAGLPGLPTGFDWRGESHQVGQRLETWKQSVAEGGRSGGERYLRRHYFRLRMSDGAIWTVYFVRQAPRGASGRQRWFLWTVQRGAGAGRG
jgi:hypothetical protein